MINKKIHHKLEQCIKDMILAHANELGFYGEFALFLNFVEDKSIKTAGVSFKKNRMYFYYNPNFIENLKTKKEVNFLVLHELFHLLWNHVQRTTQSNFNHTLSNIAQDMIINQIILDDVSSNLVEMIKDESGLNTGLLVPKNYEDSLVFEKLYVWLKEEREKWIKNGKKITMPLYGQYARNGRYSSSLESIFHKMEMNENCILDQHFPCDIPAEVKREIVNDVQNRLKARGFVNGKVSSTLGKLQKKKEDYLSQIKRGLSQIKGGGDKHKTFKRINRRNLPGIKGKIKQKSILNVLLDVSGSMGGLFEEVLSYINRSDICFNLVQCDTDVNASEKINNSKQLEKVNIKGLGGTILQPGIDYISKNFPKYNTVILTDGYCEDYLDCSKLNKVLIISTSADVKTTKNAKLIFASFD